MKYAFKPSLRDFVPWAYFFNVFTPEECEQIKKFASKKPEKALIGHGVEAKKIRDAQLTWINPTADNMFVYQRLDQLVKQANGQFWNFQLSGFFESLQLTHYKKGHHYDAHVDLGKGDMAMRKLSVVVQLSDPADYNGGKLIFTGHEKAKDVPLNQGSAILFPSFVSHKVSKVTKGERFSLVSWVSGEPFR